VLDCLVNLTGIVTRHSTRIALCLLKCGFIQRVVGPLHVHPQWAPDTWMIIANLMCLCEESRDALLHSPLFTPLPDLNSDAPPPPPPFVVQLHGADPRQLHVLLLLIAGMLDERFTLPGAHFVALAFQYLVHVLRTRLCPEPRMDTCESEDDAFMLMCVLESLGSVFAKLQPRHGNMLCELIGDSERGAAERGAFGGGFVTFLVRLIPRLSGIPFKVRVCQLLVRVGMMDHYRDELRASNCVALMAQLACTTSLVLRREGIIWLANYLSEDLDAVQECMAQNALQPMLQALRESAPTPIIMAAIFGILNACTSCYNAYRYNMSQRDAANKLLHALATRNNLLRMLCQTATAGNDQMYADILCIWHILLCWNRALVEPLLEECYALDKVSDALGHANTEVYHAAAVIQQLLDGDDGGAGYNEDAMVF